MSSQNFIMGVSKSIESFTSFLLSDLKVNGPLVAEMFNILGFSYPPSHENNMGGAQQNNMGGAQKNNMGGAQQNNMGGAENYSMGGASVGGIEDRDLSNQILPEETMLEKQMCDNGHSNMNRNSDFEATGVVVDLCNSTTTAELDGNGNQVFERQGNDPKIGNDDEEGGCGPRNNNEAAPLHFPTKSENQVCAFPKKLFQRVRVGIANWWCDCQPLVSDIFICSFDSVK